MRNHGRSRGRRETVPVPPVRPDPSTAFYKILGLPWQGRGWLAGRPEQKRRAVALAGLGKRPEQGDAEVVMLRWPDPAVGE